ncbi:MAG: hypothetical protein JO352_25930 [Chloroflexi bacterium]|nr:hypothetical protein [Chloroflexota bacterium]
MSLTLVVAIGTLLLLLMSGRSAQSSPAAKAPNTGRMSPAKVDVRPTSYVTGDLVFSPEGTNQGGAAVVAQRLCAGRQDSAR